MSFYMSREEKMLLMRALGDYEARIETATQRGYAAEDEVEDLNRTKVLMSRLRKHLRLDPPSPTEQMERAFLLREQGKSYYEIGREMGISAARASYLAKTASHRKTKETK